MVFENSHQGSSDKTRSQYLMININIVHEGHKDHQFNEIDEMINNAIHEGTKM